MGEVLMLKVAITKEKRAGITAIEALLLPELLLLV